MSKWLGDFQPIHSSASVSHCMGPGLDLRSETNVCFQVWQRKWTASCPLDEKQAQLVCLWTHTQKILRDFEVKEETGKFPLLLPQYHQVIFISSNYYPLRHKR